jgi:hypothetical protein
LGGTDGHVNFELYRKEEEMSNQEIIALLIGAGIALVSSLSTSVITTLFSDWLSRRNKRREKIARLHYLLGESVVDIIPTRDTEIQIKFWLNQKAVLDKLISVGDDNDLEGFTGIYETLSNKLKKLVTQKDAVQPITDTQADELDTIAK